MHHSLPHTTGISRCRSHLGPQELQLQMLRCLNGERQEGAWPGASGEGTGGPRRPHGAHCSREMSGKAHLGTCLLRRRWSLRDASGFCPPWTAPGAAAGASSSCCSGCRGPAWSPGAPCGGVGGPRPGCCCGDKGCNGRTRQVVSPGRDVPTPVQPRCSKPWEQQLWGDALLRAGMRESCSAWQGGEALLKTLGRAGLLFPHLGTGTGTSPSVSPSISLRASTLAEERGEKQECASQSGQHGSGPARGSAHLGFG